MLENNIEPEVMDDALADALRILASLPHVHTIIEVGAGSGEGSTRAIVDGIRKSGERKRFITIEVSKERALAVQAMYSEAIVLNACSAYLSDYMTEEQITQFYNEVPTTLNKYPLELVLSWRTEELEYILKNNIPFCGIAAATRMMKVDAPDLVFLDGSAFTGFADFLEVIGAKYIVLDDVNDIKNNTVYHVLKTRMDNLYEATEEDMTLRNGYAIFSHK